MTVYEKIYKMSNDRNAIINESDEWIEEIKKKRWNCRES